MEVAGATSLSKKGNEGIYIVQHLVKKDGCWLALTSAYAPCSRVHKKYIVSCALYYIPLVFT